MSLILCVSLNLIEKVGVEEQGAVVFDRIIWRRPNRQGVWSSMSARLYG